ncbi:MAG: gliding motility-associated C-terminal domain-containing protein [Prolixibacteraceae bacterium]|jgi:gliding motility-associated-like protein
MKYLIQFSYILIPLLLFAVKGFSQIEGFFFTGESVQFEITPINGILYSWNVLENAEFKCVVKTDQVTFLTIKNSPVIKIRWEKAGKYFLALSGVNESGCSNMRIYPMIVSNDHIPVAVDDYVIGTWLTSIRVNALGNDYDLKNDLDTSSLKMLTKAEYGDVTISTGGEIKYVPIKNHSGRDCFYYRICDKRNMCDTAMITIDIKDPPLFFPEGISPNGDGLNDRFIIKGLEAFDKSSLTIFSRDGVVIYLNDDYQNDWSGLQNTKNHAAIPVPPGTYYYLLCLGGTRRIIKGFVYLTK